MFNDLYTIVKESQNGNIRILQSKLNNNEYLMQVNAAIISGYTKEGAERTYKSMIKK